MLASLVKKEWSLFPLNVAYPCDLLWHDYGRYDDVLVLGSGLQGPGMFLSAGTRPLLYKQTRASLMDNERHVAEPPTHSADSQPTIGYVRPF